MRGRGGGERGDRRDREREDVRFFSPSHSSERLFRAGAFSRFFKRQRKI